MKKKILVVDDDPSVVLITKTRLEVKGYMVQEAGNGQEAVRIASEWKPDLILLDMMMPIMDGYEACQQLKQQAQTAHIPIVVLTASREMGTKSLQVGAKQMLLKPVTSEMLNDILMDVFGTQ